MNGSASSGGWATPHRWCCGSLSIGSPESWIGSRTCYATLAGRASWVRPGGRPSRCPGLEVISHIDVADGPVEVTVASRIAVSVDDFRVLPNPLADEDRLPTVLRPRKGQPGDPSPTGQTSVLVALVNPSDRVPGAGSTARQTIVDNWDTVLSYHQQASFGTKMLQRDIPAGWTTLSGNTADYCDFVGEENIKKIVLPRLYAEAAMGARTRDTTLTTTPRFPSPLFLAGTFGG